MVGEIGNWALFKQKDVKLLIFDSIRSLGAKIHELLHCFLRLKTKWLNQRKLKCRIALFYVI